MRFILRFILLIPMLLSLVLFGSVHWQETTGLGGQKIRTVKLGISPSPWFEYRKEYTHESKWDALLTLANEAMESAEDLAEPDSGGNLPQGDDRGSKTLHVDYRVQSSWHVVLLSWSWPFGFLAFILFLFYRKLGKPRQAGKK